ncbi:protein SLOW WALKER 1-like [Chenopodium quinoa]|uniref:U3 small nucleolar RNA-associated protein 15 C-terminal domain-containing protein n=1 Tax=Chenopodium quinoa TaxID=63459 RepID=A0A803MZE7_CHEQI|nr:protein SLOW WALKER 1-like [Chenopodium quinoa]
MAELQTFPTKPRLKPTSKKSNNSPESKFWKSFKTHEISGLVSSITSIDFSPQSPHHFAATYGASLSFFNPHHSFSPSEPINTIRSFKDTSYSASYRSDSKLIAAGCQSGVIHVFEAKTRNALRQLKGHSRPVRLVQYPRVDRLHLFSGGDDSVVKYWDVATETSLCNFLGHKDYVRSGSASPVDDKLFVTGSYDHTVRVWDVRGSKLGSSAMVVNHGKPVEDVTFLPSGGLIATAGGNVVKIWDVIGGGKCVYSMESHNKTVTSICVGKVGKDSGEESDQYRLLTVGLDGYLKVLDYSKLKITFSMRFPAPLVSVGFSPDGSTRVIGTSNGIIYMAKRKKEKVEERSVGDFVGFQYREEPRKRVLKPSFFRYFHRGQSEKPKGGEYLVLRPKKVKLAEHDKLLKKFRHKDAFVAVLQKKNPENVVAVMEELVARKKLFRCVTNLDVQELELLLVFLQKYTTLPRYAGLLIPFANKVIQMRAEDIRGCDGLKAQLRNLKRTIQEELRIQQSLLEIQGIISPLMRIAGKR